HRHYCQIRMALALEPPARLHAIEIAVDVELEVDRGVIPRPSDVQRLDRLEAQFLQIKPVNERIDHANRIILADPVIEASRQQRQLPPIRLLNEPRHLSPPPFSKRIIASGDFSPSVGHNRVWRPRPWHASSSLSSGPFAAPQRTDAMCHQPSFNLSTRRASG